MPSPEEDLQQQLDRIEARQEELLSELKWLLHTQSGLDSRLSRVEDSMVFRTLRAVGRTYQTKLARKKAGATRAYAEWRARSGSPPPPTTPLRIQPLISVMLKIRQPSRARLERALQSLRAQTYPYWEVIPVLDGDAPNWAKKLLGKPKAATGAWLAYLGENDFLSPTAFEHFIIAIQSHSVDMVYSDAELVDSAGRPLRPIFKPDWSPVLLRHAPYTGGLRMERATLQGAPSTAIQITSILYHSGEPELLLPSPETRPKHLITTPLVTTIVCTRNSVLLARCLEGLRGKTAYHQKEVVVVQHLGSTSPSEERAVEAVIQRFNAKRVTYSGPFNFATMNNVGVAEAEGSLLLFLNDDVEPIGPNWMSRMVSHFDDQSVGAVGAKLLYPNGAIQHAGIATWLIDGAGHPGRNLFHSENWHWLHYTREVTAVTGACLMVRRADFEMLHGFDPVFPVNYNDVDLCLRLRAAGFSVIIDANAVLRHDESQTRRPGTQYEERRLFFRRWSHVVEHVDPYYSPHLAQNNEDLSLR
jgi:GT2 family glycosyltransferase